MLPIGDENPHPPGFKPKLTYALIAVNVIIFFFEVAVTGQFFDFAMVDQNGIYPNTIKM
jgi:membrane associated rhomboid family serine protease